MIIYQCVILYTWKIALAMMGVHDQRFAAGASTALRPLPSQNFLFCPSFLARLVPWSLVKQRRKLFGSRPQGACYCRRPEIDRRGFVGAIDQAENITRRP
jgi:hypothetical protein